MLRILFYWFIVLVVGSIVVYYYQTRQIDNALDEMSQQVAPFGRLDHGGSSFSLTGEARINQLRFRPHGSNEDIRIERMAVKTGSLMKLMTLNRTVEDGRLPSQLGFALRGIRFPLDGPIFESMGESGSPGIAFDAAGCGDREYFDGRDLAAMGYLDFTGSLDLDYRLVGDVDAVNWSMEILGDEMNRIRLETNIGVSARSSAFQDLAMAAESLSLRTIDFEYEDLGYYPRLIEYCADEMEMSREEYIEHHIAVWQAQWLEEGMVAGPTLVDAYERFLNDPGTMSGRIIPTGNVLGLLERGVDPSRLLSAVNVTISLNGEEVGPLDLRYATREERQGADSGGTSSGGGSAAGAMASGSGEATTGWQQVAVGNLRRHEGAQVMIVLQDGRERTGRLVTVDGERILLERRLRGGYMEVPIGLSDIAEAQVWH